MPDVTDPDQVAEVSDRVHELTEAHRRLAEAVGHDPASAARHVAATRRAALAVVGALFRRPDGSASHYEMTPKELLSHTVAELQDAARLAHDPGQAIRYLELASQLAVYASPRDQP